MSLQESQRKPHAVMDLPSRRAKGLKIERLLGLSSRQQPIRLLDIGTGNGGIAYYFASHESLHCEVTSVDLIDQRLVRDGYRFVQVDGPDLPFADDSFDVVISNHVIEHVGTAPAQERHLLEVRRVLASGGVGYLAVPNRWMLVEPHYRLLLLSWLPRYLRTPYLRLMGRGKMYDCEPLTVPEVECLFSACGFEFRHLHVESIQETFRIEGAPCGLGWLQSMPPALLMSLRRVSPTLIYSFWRPGNLAMRAVQAE